MGQYPVCGGGCGSGGGGGGTHARTHARAVCVMAGDTASPLLRVLSVGEEGVSAAPHAGAPARLRRQMVVLYSITIGTPMDAGRATAALALVSALCLVGLTVFKGYLGVGRSSGAHSVVGFEIYGAQLLGTMSWIVQVAQVAVARQHVAVLGSSLRDAPLPGFLLATALVLAYITAAEFAMGVVDGKSALQIVLEFFAGAFPLWNIACGALLAVLVARQAADRVAACTDSLAAEAGSGENIREIVVETLRKVFVAREAAQRMAMCAVGQLLISTVSLTVLLFGVRLYDPVMLWESNNVFPFIAPLIVALVASFVRVTAACQVRVSVVRGAVIVCPALALVSHFAVSPGARGVEERAAAGAVLFDCADASYGHAGPPPPPQALHIAALDPSAARGDKPAVLEVGAYLQGLQSQGRLSFGVFGVAATWGNVARLLASATTLALSAVAFASRN